MEAMQADADAGDARMVNSGKLAPPPTLLSPLSLDGGWISRFSSQIEQSISSNRLKSLDFNLPH